MDILSYALQIIGLIGMITASLLKGKDMKKILALVLASNLCVGFGYLAGGTGLNGAASCFLGALMTFINYFFEVKNKDIPKWLVAIYAVSFIGVNLAVAYLGAGISYLTAIAIVAALAFIMCIGQKNGAKYRFWTIVNMTLWCSYDALSATYSALFNHIPLLLFTVAGMLIHDRKKK